VTKYVFVDTETTGLDPDRCEIWEIGAILRDDDQPDMEYCWQIRPALVGAEPVGLRIGRYYQRLHPDLLGAGYGVARRIAHPHGVPGDGHTLERTSAGEIAADLAHLLDGAFLVGAVPWFDERFLQRFFAVNNQAATNHYHLVDVETLAAGALKLTPKWDFDAVLAAYGLVYDEADRHTALGDARMARDLFDAVYRTDETG
jgi:DNA polymerase III epsilon subunit-like protein